MGDGHRMVIDHIGEIVGRVAVRFEENLVLQLAVVDRDLTIDGILKGRRAGQGHFLADDRRDAGSQVGLHDFSRQVAAMAVIATGEIARGLGCGTHALEALLAAEAMVGLAGRHKLLGLGTIQVQPLTLDIGAMRATHIRAFIVGEADLAQRMVDQVEGTLDLAFLVGILDAQDERATQRPGDQVFIECGAQVANMHHASRTRGVAGTDSRCRHGKPRIVITVASQKCISLFTRCSRDASNL